MAELKYPKLFSPITIRGKTFRNRILVAPTGVDIPDEGDDGRMSDQCIEFYRGVAHGGCARVCSGENDVEFACAVRGMYPFLEEQPTEKFRESIKKFSDACHSEGALAFTSFCHMGLYGRTFGEVPFGAEREGEMGPPPGMYMPKKANGEPYPFPTEVYGPSAMVIDEPWDGITRRGPMAQSHDGTVVTEITLKKMNELADAFAHCAKVAKECGLDGMNIHSGHGFLFGQWVSRRFNRRTDEYGGSAENRARFPIMVLSRIREAVGEDFIVELRFSGEEHITPLTERIFYEDMLTIEDTVEFFQELDKYPGLVDIAHISAGVHMLPIYNTRVTANFYYPMAYNADLAARVKAAVKNMAVGVVGSLSDPDVCEEVIASGKADFVILSRQLLVADPDFPNKAREGRTEDIDTCLRCAQCRSNRHCAVNPVNWMNCSEAERYIENAGVNKKVAIVGGGIAGMKAAEFAARRGFETVLFEKEAELGGILRYTDHERFKGNIKRYKDNLALRLKKLGVDIRLGKAVGAGEVKRENADAVLVATGGVPAPLAVGCKAGISVPDALEAYLSPSLAGETVAVIGGGLTGCEAAIHWADLGKKVTLISRSPELMKNVRSPDTHLLMLDELGVNVLKGYACTGITASGVTARGPEGERLIPADTVINAAGMRAAPDAAQAFKGTAAVVTAIGDCVDPALINDAVLSAYRAVMAL